MSLTFAELRDANIARRRIFAGCDEWTLNDWMTALAGEVGEAANVLKKIRRGDYTLEDARDALESELADVQCYLDLLAYYADIDLAQATTDKFNHVSKRMNSAVRL